MRVSVLFVDEKEELQSFQGVDIDVSKSKPFDISELESVEDHVRRAVELWNLSEPIQHYALQICENKEYIVEQEDLTKLHENSMLFLKISPIDRAESCISQLNEGSRLKQIMFNMRFQVQDPGFAEEFIARDGIAILLTILGKSDERNVQAYSLTALLCCMSYYNGLQQFLDAPELVERLFRLVSVKAVTVSRKAVELLFVLCNYNGWELVYNSAQNLAKQQGKEPFHEIFALLEQSDLDSRLNALTLLNSILENAPDRDVVKALVSQWRDNFSLSNLIQTQLDIFYTNAAEFLEAPTLSKVDQLAEYEAQQPLLQILVAELAHCHQAIAAAQQDGVPISAKTPTQRFEKQKTWNISDRPVDLSYLKRTNPVEDKLSRLNLLRKQRTGLDSSPSHSAERKQSVPDFHQHATPSTPSVNEELLSKKNEELTNKVKEKDTLIKQLEASLTEQQSLVSQHQRDLASAKQALLDHTLNNSNNNNKDKSDGDEDDDEEDEDRNVDIKTSNNNNENDSALRGEIEEAKRNAQQFKSQAQQLEQQLEQSKQSLTQSHSQLEQTKQLLAQTNQQVAALQQQLAHLQANPPSAPSGNVEGQADANSIPPPPPGMDAAGGPPPPPPPPGMGGEGGPPPPPPPPGMDAGGPPPPPPPPGGGPPGPPPLPGMGGPPPLPGMGRGQAKPTKPVIHPKNKLKPLFWKRILNTPADQASAKTCWNDIQELDIDPNELEDVFSVKKTEKVVSADATAGNASGNKKKVTNVLDPKTSNSIAIMLNSLPPSDDLVRAILQLDNSVLKRDQIGILLQNLPTPEDIEAVKTAASTLSDADPPLDKPELFCVAISSIPKIKERLQCWSFKMSAKEKFSDVTNALQLIFKAAGELQSSSQLKKVFGLILSIGNYLNGGSARGQADGFQIDVLPKINDTKGNSGDSLLMYMIRIMHQKFPDLLHLPNEIAHSLECTKLSLAEVEKNLGKLTGETKQFSTLVESVLAVDSAGKFSSIMKEFVSDCERKLADAKEEYEKTAKRYETVVAYFGGRKDYPSEEFFGVFATFLDQFTQCERTFQREIEDEQKQKLRGASGMVKRENAGKKIGGEGGGADPMMNIIAAIRAGKASGLKKAEDLPKASSEAAEPAQPFKFNLRKVEQVKKEDASAPQLSELQMKLSARK